MARKILGNLIDPVAPAALYTAGVGKQADVIVFISNSTANPVSPTVYAVENGGVAGTDNEVVSAEPIEGNGNMQIAIPLGPGDSIHVKGSAVGLTFVAAGDEADAI